MYKFISLESIDSMLTEARNTLAYTFHLNYDPTHIKSIIDSNVSEDVFAVMSNYMHEACSPLFWSSFSTQANSSKHDGLYDVGFQFFGDSYRNSPIGPLGCLDTHQYCRVWEAMLTHHCLLATYDKLFNMIFYGIPIHSYHLSRLFHCWGFNYVLEKDIFHVSITDHQFQVDELHKNTQKGATDSNTASNNSLNSYPSSFNTLRDLFDKHEKYHDLGNIIQLIPNPQKAGKNKDVIIPMGMIPLLQQMRGKGKDFANIFKLYDSKTYSSLKDTKKFMESVTNIRSEPIKLIDDETEQHMTRADILYYQYKLEQTFHFDLVYCLSKNIISFDKRFNQRMRDDLTLIDIVTSVVAFPNTISRNLLVQMAFDCCTDSLCLDNSLLEKRLRSPDAVASFIKRPKKLTDSHNYFNDWKICYNNFVNYMTELVFPIYESYFLVMIYDAFSDPEKSTAENILKLYFELNNYLSTETVFNAMSNDSYMETIMQIHNSDYDKDKKVLKAADFIVPNYSDMSINFDIFAKVVLSTYNHIPKDTPALISRDYLYKNFPRTKESLIISCTSGLLED